MPFLIERDYATMFLDGGTILLMIIVMILSTESRKRGREDDKFFFLLLIVNCLLAVGDTIGYLFRGKTVPYSSEICRFGATFFSFFYVVFAVFWKHYCRVRFKERGASSGGLKRPEYIPGLVLIALVIINIFTGWIFSVDNNGDIHAGMLYTLADLCVTLYVFAGFYHLWRYRSNRSGRVVIPIWVYILPVTLSIVFSYLVPDSPSFEPIGIAMTITFTYMGTINESLEFNYSKEK